MLDEIHSLAIADRIWLCVIASARLTAHPVQAGCSWSAEALLDMFDEVQSISRVAEYCDCSAGCQSQIKADLCLRTAGHPSQTGRRSSDTDWELEDVRMEARLTPSHRSRIPHFGRHRLGV